MQSYLIAVNLCITVTSYKTKNLAFKKEENLQILNNP